MQSFKGKVAFVTGGASGIGLGIVSAFLREGMKVVIADLRQDHIDSALDQLRSEGHADNVHAIRLDVTDRAAMVAAADETLARFGKLHVLVNNAGVGIEGPLSQATYDDWDFGLSVNLGGVINGIQTFVPLIRSHGEGGHILSTASLAGLCVLPAHMAIYVTTKAAVISLMESLRGELAPENIGVSVLCPGPVKSSIHELNRNRPPRFKPSAAFAQAAEKLARRDISPLWMEPAEVAAMVVKGIREDQLYIITHGEWREVIKSRFDAILAAMPEHTNPDLIASMRPPEKR